MTIAIIGATGQLGGHTVDGLLERGTAADDVLALGRDPERLATLAERGCAPLRSTSTTSRAPRPRSRASTRCC